MRSTIDRFNLEAYFKEECLNLKKTNHCIVSNSQLPRSIINPKCKVSFLVQYTSKFLNSVYARLLLHWENAEASFVYFSASFDTSFLE